MRKEVLLEQFERRLLELECPRKKLRRRVDELSLHHDFLKRTALKEGLTEESADAQASRQLGEPVALAEAAADEARQASWWGRHPIIGFILLPLLTLLPALIAGIFLMVVILLLRIPQQQLNGYFNGSNLKEINGLLQALFAIHYLVLTLFAIPFMWLARRSGAGLKWGAAACAIFAAQGMFLHLVIVRNGSPLGYRWTPNLLGAVGPVTILAGGLWRQWRMTNRLPELPANVKRRPTGLPALNELLQTPLGEKRIGATNAPPARPKGEWFRGALRTPTYWVMILLVVVVIPLLMLASGGVKRMQAANRAKTANLQATLWPKEREEVAQEVAARQAARDTFNETTIDLGPYLNTQLSDSTDGRKGLKDNNLLELPQGTHTYGGVPFDVQGRIQLMGHGLEQWQRVFPVRVKDIKIGKKCGKIFLFHGENCAQRGDVRDVAVAKLVLHYADGSQQEIPIKSGDHLLDWWGPIYKTQVDPAQRNTKSPDSELAWIGKNPWIQRNRPEFSLRLYKSTFENPQPATEIATIDYVSTMTDAAPFMVAMTVE